MASVVGLCFTIWAVWRAKAAAERARDAAEEVRRQISSFDTIADVSAAIAILDEIKRLQRLQAWDIVLDRYSVLRRHLVRIEQSDSAVTDAQKNAVARAMSQFRIMEKKVETARVASAPSSPADLIRFSQIVSAHIDTLERVMMEIRRAKE